MPTHDDSPATWSPGEFGVLKIRGNRGSGEYQITPLDAILLGTMAKHEEHYPYLALWALVQRFAGFKHNRSDGLNSAAPNSLATYTQQFSAPVNPAFAFSGRPIPTRAVGRCPNGKRGRGRLPPAHPSGVPTRPSQRTWNIVMCSCGRRPSHGNDSESTKAARRRRFETIRRAAQGDSGAWRTLTDATGRLALWNLLHGQAGNPIPGFDNWAACWAYRRGRALRRRIILPNLSVSEQEQALQRIRSMSTSELRSHSTYIPVRFGAAMSGARKEGFGQVSRSNCFLYHTLMNNGDEVWVEWSNGTRLYDSRRAEVDMSHFEGGPAASVDGGGTSAATPEGLAPTTGRPSNAASPGNVASGGPGGRSGGRTQIGVSRRPSELGSEEEIFSDLEQWANNMEDELTREFGRGRTSI